MPNLIPQDIREWMRRQEFKVNDLTRRMSTLIPGDIADGVDLNGYMSSGRWRRASTTGTTTALNYPFNGAGGTLEVYWDAANVQVQQVFFDRAGSIWIRWWTGAVWTAWNSSSSGGIPLPVLGQVAGAQTITSSTLAVLPTPVTAAITVPAGTTIVQASVSCLVGSGTTFTPSTVVSLRYWLSGALTYQPGSLTSGVGGVNQPVGSGGGTLSLNHTVTVTAATTLTAEAMAVVHVGATCTIRDVRVQLTALRRA